MKPVLLEYRGQLCTGEVVRSFGPLRKVRVDSAGGYFLAWVPRWRIVGPC